MLWRIFEKILTWGVVLVVLLVLIKTLGHLASVVLGALGRVMPPFLESVLGTLVVGAFGIGLTVRCANWFRGRDLASVRRRAAHEERGQLAVRRPALDLPTHGQRAVLQDDPDPALGPDGGEADA